MDISLELHCDRCGSAHLSLSGEAILCDDCGSAQGTVAQLREELAAAALRRTAR